MNRKILIVDDEKNLRDGIKRQLRDNFDVLTAESGKVGLAIIKKEGPFAVVISDYKMPEMNGVELLENVKRIAPDTVRIMLTGQADMQATIDVINKGNIFRFLTKPCTPDLMKKNLNDGIEQYRLINAEKELLEKTLSGSIKVMTEALALAKPNAFGRAVRIRKIVKELSKKMDISDSWQMEVASMLSQIGCITIPDSVLTKVYRNMKLLPDEKLMFERHMEIGSEMIAKIPRLENVAKIILYQEKYYNGSGFPHDKKRGDELPIGSRLLKIALDFDKFTFSGMSTEEAIEKIKSARGLYDESIVKALEDYEPRSSKKRYVIKELGIDRLNENMLLLNEIVTASGVIIGGKNQKITPSLIVTLNNYKKNNEIKEPIKIVMPSEY